MKKFVALLLGCAMPLALVKADPVTINFQSDQVTDEFDVGLADGRLVLLLASVATPVSAGGGFDQLFGGSLNVGDLLNGEYQILGRAAVDQFLLPGEFNGSTGSIPLTGGLFPNLSTGDQLAVAWFPTLSESTDFSLAAGTSYGLYTIDSDIGWQVPVGGTTSFDLTVPSGTAASFTVAAIPEPSSYAVLGGLGVLAFGLARRRLASGPAHSTDGSSGKPRSL